jgi:hypothetical protein
VFSARLVWGAASALNVLRYKFWGKQKHVLTLPHRVRRRGWGGKKKRKKKVDKVALPGSSKEQKKREAPGRRQKKGGGGVCPFVMGTPLPQLLVIRKFILNTGDVRTTNRKKQDIIFNRKKKKSRCEHWGGKGQGKSFLTFLFVVLLFRFLFVDDGKERRKVMKGEVHVLLGAYTIAAWREDHTLARTRKKKSRKTKNRLLL